MEVKRQKEIYVIGHKNPDTDSVCSAIAYASLKNEILARVQQGDSIEHYQDFLIEGEESGQAVYVPAARDRLIRKQIMSFGNSNRKCRYI